MLGKFLLFSVITTVLQITEKSQFTHTKPHLLVLPISPVIAMLLTQLHGSGSLSERLMYILNLYMLCL